MGTLTRLMDDYLPIAEHGVIGDLHTIALVGTNGTIDWLCWPRFDSPSVFGSILDAGKGGHYRAAPADGYSVKQLYFPDTNVLITRFLTPDGVGEVQDFMPIHRSTTTPSTADAAGDRRARRRSLPGRLPAPLQLRPRAATTGDASRRRRAFHSPRLSSPCAAKLRWSSAGRGGRRLLAQHGQSATFVLEKTARGRAPRISEGQAAEAFNRTVRFWRGWLAHSRYRGRWREMVHRSALTLKLLTYAPTGAIVAAPTTSLPEQLGGERNWDYRYTWIRDAAFSLYALLRLGFTEEAAAFMDWLTDRFRDGRAVQPGRSRSCTASTAAPTCEELS